MHTLPLRLRHARMAASLATRELDRLAAMTQGHTWLIESGRRPNPESDTLRKIASVLGISLDWLILGSGDTPLNEEIARAVEAHRSRASGAEVPPPASSTVLDGAAEHPEVVGTSVPIVEGGYIDEPVATRFVELDDLAFGADGEG